MRVLHVPLPDAPMEIQASPSALEIDGAELSCVQYVQRWVLGLRAQQRKNRQHLLGQAGQPRQRKQHDDAFTRGARQPRLEVGSSGAKIFPNPRARFTPSKGWPTCARRPGVARLGTGRGIGGYVAQGLFAGRALDCLRCAKQSFDQEDAM
jgi:hypothetical protein